MYYVLAWACYFKWKSQQIKTFPKNFTQHMVGGETFFWALELLKQLKL